ncbi:Probable metal transport system membrane protein CT_070 [Chlamydiales bacterium SCGC AG-110-M15]|nr:Probable metal transport system membrane protein CT_070 [Chlamydiales bacterium SCGC AG-110-M15]
MIGCLAYSNPYHGLDFIHFFIVLFQRLFMFLTGRGGGLSLAADEIQVLVLIGVSISSGIVGTFLVLRKMTMLANALSHTILLGIVGVFLFTQFNHHAEGHHEFHLLGMLIAAVVTGILTTFLTEFLTQTVHLQEDASTGLVFTTLFSIAIILVSMFTRNAHIGIEVVMGNVDALHVEDLKLVYAILLLNVCVFTAFFKEFKLTSFDSQLAKSLGVSTVFFNYFIMTQASLTSIGAFRAVGVLMVLAFIVGPTLTARLLTNDLKALILLSGGLGSLASFCGVAFSRHYLSVYGIPLATSGVTVCMIALFFGLAIVCSPKSGLFIRWLRRRKLKQKVT